MNHGEELSRGLAKKIDGWHDLPNKFHLGFSRVNFEPPLELPVVRWVPHAKRLDIARQEQSIEAASNERFYLGKDRLEVARLAPTHGRIRFRRVKVPETWALRYVTQSLNNEDNAGLVEGTFPSDQTVVFELLFTTETQPLCNLYLPKGNPLNYQPESDNYRHAEFIDLLRGTILLGTPPGKR